MNVKKNALKKTKMDAFKDLKDLNSFLKGYQAH